MPSFNKLTAGVFCRELACGIEPLDDLLESWELTPDDYAALRKNPWFQKELIAAVAEIKDLGPNSTFIMKCRGIADENIGSMHHIIQNERNDPRVRTDAFKLITELGRLGAPKSEGRSETGPSVIFNFGGSLKDIPETLTITATPELLSKTAV